MPKGYFNPALPEGLKTRIKKLIEDHPELGYTSVSGFVSDATRRRLEEIDKMVKEETA